MFSQARALNALGHAPGGEPAARLATALGLHTSADTVLREPWRSSQHKRQGMTTKTVAAELSIST